MSFVFRFVDEVLQFVEGGVVEIAEAGLHGVDLQVVVRLYMF